MAKQPKTFDEVIGKIKAEVGEIDSDLIEELREVAHPKGARDEIASLKKQLTDQKPMVEAGQKALRAPEVEKAFEAYDTSKLPPVIKDAMFAFDGIGDASKVAEFAKSYGIPAKPAEQQGTAQTATGQVVDAATAAVPGTNPGATGDATLLQTELRDAEARGASKSEQAAIMAKHGLNVTNGPVAQAPAPAPAVAAP